MTPSTAVPKEALPCEGDADRSTRPVASNKSQMVAPMVKSLEVV